MTTIIGIDGALADTGLAVWSDGLISVRTIHTPPGPPEPRWEAIGNQVWPIARKDPNTLIALEGVFVGAKMAGTALDLAFLHSVLRMGFYTLHVPVVVIDVMAIKQYAVGVGKATPREMIAATSRMRLKFNVEDDHQADALFEVAMTLDHYGRPMCDTFPAGRKALERPAWPRFELAPPAATEFEEHEQATRRTPIPSPFMASR